MKLIINSRSYEVEVLPDTVVVDGVSYKTTVLYDNGEITVRVAGRPYKVKVKDEKTVTVDGRPLTVELSGRPAAPRPAAKTAPPVVRKGGDGAATGTGAESGAVKALMPGTVREIRVSVGDQVGAGAVLLMLEAMKMQNEIRASHAGVVKRIAVAPGQTVNSGDVMVVIG